MTQVMEREVGPPNGTPGSIPGWVQGPGGDGSTVLAGEQLGIRLGADRTEAFIDVGEDVLGNGQSPPPSIRLRWSLRESASFELDPGASDGEQTSTSVDVATLQCNYLALVDTRRPAGPAVGIRPVAPPLQRSPHSGLPSVAPRRVRWTLPSPGTAIVGWHPHQPLSSRSWTTADRHPQQSTGIGGADLHASPEL